MTELKRFEVMVNIEQPTIDCLIIKVRELITAINSILEDKNEPAATELIKAKSGLVTVLCDTLMAKEAQQNPINYQRIIMDMTYFTED